MNETSKKVAEESGLPESDVAKVLESLAKVAHREAVDGLFLPGIGTISVGKFPDREGTNPFTGEPVVFKGPARVEFAPIANAMDFFATQKTSVEKVKADSTPPSTLPEIRLHPNQEDIDEHCIDTSGLTRDGIKLGGAPSWVQCDETPDCPNCGKQIQFYAQIDSAVGAEFYIGDVGVLYIFRCENCWRSQNVMQCT